METPIDQDPRCTCQDPFKTEICPVCFPIRVPEAGEAMIITDADMVPGDARSWSGYTYTCQKCTADAIMYMMKYCGNCGSPVSIQSEKLTAHINRLQEKRKDGGI